jgi:hypothetical protein
MKSLIYYEVYDDYSEDGMGGDLCGRNRDKVIAKFTEISDAEEYAKGRGNWGQNAWVRLCTLDIFESLEEVSDK